MGGVVYWILLGAGLVVVAAVVVIGWRANEIPDKSRLIHLVFFSTTVLAAFGAVYIFTKEELIESESASTLLGVLVTAVGVKQFDLLSKNEGKSRGQGGQDKPG